MEEVPASETLTGMVKRFYDEYSLISPFKTHKQKRHKKWWVLEVVEECCECDHKDYRLVWPWMVTYDDVPELFATSWLAAKYTLPE